SAHLHELGINDVVLVTGYLREQIAPHLPRLRMREIVNERFHEGSVVSLAVALPEIEGEDEPVLLMDADVLYPREMLARLIRSSAPTALLIDRDYSTADDDPVLVPVRNGKPFDFVKRWTGLADWVGESIGFFKMGAQDVPMLAAETRARAAGANVTDSYDDVLRVMVQAGRFSFEDVTGVPWTEIDFPEDVTRAREVVLPSLQNLS
ncbi:MAG TPA: NTP transferase domain-containing protein, partial [Chthoniobacterales bacterium]|nr:NTP transferase domain-containing protein [Chthoniobacterales bacterium]